MDIQIMISELKRERERIDQTIMVLRRLALGGRRKRGRPPKYLAETRIHKNELDGGSISMQATQTNRH